MLSPFPKGNDICIVGNLGSSKVVLGVQDEEEGAVESILLTEDHSWNDDEECKRAQKAGGRIAQLKQ